MMVPASIASAVMIIILEGAVVAFNYMRFKAPLHIQKWRSDGSSPTESVRDQSLRKILRVGIIDTIADCIHIVLLIAVGFGMIEAVGHSDLHSWRVRCFYNFGVIYTYLTLLAVASSLFRQLANSGKHNLFDCVHSNYCNHRTRQTHIHTNMHVLIMLLNTFFTTLLQKIHSYR